MKASFFNICKSDYVDPRANFPINLSSFSLKALERVVQRFVLDHEIKIVLINSHSPGTFLLIRPYKINMPVKKFMVDRKVDPSRLVVSRSAAFTLIKLLSSCHNGRGICLTTGPFQHVFHDKVLFKQLQFDKVVLRAHVRNFVKTILSCQR